tara:strand:- start:6175 stop:8010 length:1836 start_codon:yes stop_codon:yes gene_type:complete
MKQGPIALIDENMPVIVVAINKGHYDKTVSNIQEIKALKGKVIAIVTAGGETVKALADHVIEVPETLECLPTINHHSLAIIVLPYGSTLRKKCTPTAELIKIDDRRIKKEKTPKLKGRLNQDWSESSGTNSSRSKSKREVKKMNNNNNNIPKVIDIVVNNDLCIGCGMCVYKCPSKALEMGWNENGFLVPSIIDDCDSNGDCLSVCPFNPFPKKEVKTEDELAEKYLPDTNQFHKKIGKYNNIYAGYSNEFRLSSSSGGLATYVCAELLEKKIVHHIFSIKETSKPNTHYEYSVSSNKTDLLIASKTRYFPVTLATVLKEIDKLEGTIAIVGVACFIKSIRLAQHSDPKLKEKITFLIGIICGGVKSRFFTEYLASKMDIKVANIQKPQFRKKDITSTANDYSFTCSDMDQEEKAIRMKTVGDMWGTGLFKANACDFCDDVTTELADISLGDAWLDPYYKDGSGTNVVVTRSLIAENLIKEGITNKDLVAGLLPLEDFLASQQGSFNHRHTGLPSRIKMAKKNNQLIPPKRYENENVTTDFKIVQNQRMKIRAKSLEVWRNSPDAKSFDIAMGKSLSWLRCFTKINHKRKGVTHKKNRLFEIIQERFFSKK